MQCREVWVCTSLVVWSCRVPPVWHLRVTWLEWLCVCACISIPCHVHCCLSALSTASPDFCGIEGAESGDHPECRRIRRADISPSALEQPGQDCRLWVHHSSFPSLTHAQGSNELRFTPLLKRLQREGDGNAVQTHTESLFLSCNP